MAIFTPGSIISEIRGSVGTDTYSKTFAGPVVKQKIAPYPVGSGPQLSWQDRVAAGVAAWQALTDAQRRQFTKAAKSRRQKSSLGLKKPMTGYALFMSRYLLASKAGEEANLYPLAKKMNVRYEIAAINLSTTAFEIAVRNPGVLASTRLTIYATGPLSPGITWINPALLWMVRENGTSSAGLQVIDFTTDYETKYGSIAGLAGQRVAVGLMCWNYETGEKTPIYQLNQIVT